MSSLIKIPSGVQYFFDDEVKLRRGIERRVMEVFEKWSYDEIILPMFDYHDLFARGMGEEKASRTFRFTDREGALLALRPEMTSLVARTAATRFKHKPRPLRVFYSGEVFRYDEPTERSTREFHQLGIEHIGQPIIDADLETLHIAVEVLKSLAIHDFKITLSHKENVLTQTGESTKIENHETAHNELSTIYAALCEEGLGDHFDVDMGATDGFDYYTGLRFKIFVPEVGTEIGGGGRYDNLIGNFGAPEPAVGFSISLDGLTNVISNRNRTKESRKLTIAISKGRMQDDALSIFDRAGIKIDPNELNSRKLKIDSIDGQYSFIFVKPSDVPTYVEYGTADLGICGQDVVLESRADVNEMLDLKIGYCKIAVAAKREVAGGDYNLLSVVRVATKYPNIAVEYFHSKGIPVEVISLSGSIELAPILGLADRIVDLVETGRTLKENGLEVTDVITETTARLIANRAAFHLKKQSITKLINDLSVTL